MYGFATDPFSHRDHFFSWLPPPRPFYKLASFNADPGRTLQSYFDAALKARGTAVERREALESEGCFRLVNYHSSHLSTSVGEFLNYTAGHKQPTASIDPSAKFLNLATLSPPAEQDEFLHSIVYFAIAENHVITSQTASLKARQLESYLNWLFRDTGVFDEAMYVQLCDQKPLKVRLLRQPLQTIVGGSNQWQVGRLASAANRANSERVLQTPCDTPLRRPLGSSPTRQPRCA